MACGKSQASMAEEEAWPFSVSYCRKQGEKLSDSWRKELLNGQVLLVLTIPQICSSSPFDVNIWIERLKALGIQMTADQWKKLIQHAVLKPEVKKYLFYNSRAFGIAIAVVLYVTLWLSLYSTLLTFAAGQPWLVSIEVTLVSLVAALVIRLITHHYQSKMNMNTDMRLVAANEVFMKHEFLVGFTVIPDKHLSIPQMNPGNGTSTNCILLAPNKIPLWFVHFDVGPCLHSLTDSVAEMKRNQELALKQRLDELCIVIETTILPSLEEKPGSFVEESPLLSERRNSSRSALTCQNFLHLLPEGTPEAMAQQLLTIYSGYYIRLLVSGQLPSITTGRHVALGQVPCLCQFIENMMLGKQSTWFKLR